MPSDVSLNGSLGSNVNIGILSDVRLSAVTGFTDGQTLTLAYQTNLYTLTVDPTYWALPGGATTIAGPGTSGTLPFTYSATTGSMSVVPSDFPVKPLAEPTVLTPTTGTVVLDGDVNNNFTLDLTGNADLGEVVNFSDNQNLRITYKCNGFTLTANPLHWKMPSGGGLLANPSMPAGLIEGYYSALLGCVVFTMGDNIR
jgi:hypothetical protein